MVGGKANIWRNAGEAGLMSFSATNGYFFAIVLIIGIVASNAFHPGMWQRVYTIESQRSLNRTLLTAVAIAIPLTFIMGLAGVAAVGNGSVVPFQYPDVAAALFALANLGRRVVAPSQEYDFAVLNSSVGLIDEPAVAGD